MWTHIWQSCQGHAKAANAAQKPKQRTLDEVEVVGDLAQQRQAGQAQAVGAPFALLPFAPLAALHTTLVQSPGKMSALAEPFCHLKA